MSEFTSLLGEPALSDFRKRKLVRRLACITGPKAALEAHFVYLVESEATGQGSDPDPLQCENPVAEQYQLGIDLGVTGTPALLTSSGQLIPGYVPPEQLRDRLDRMASAPAAN